MYCLEFGLKPKSGKEIMKYRKNMLALLIAGSLLTACGGGGSDISGGSSSSGNSSSGDSSSSGGSTVTAGAPASIIAADLTSNFIALKGYSSVKSETASVTFTVYDAAGVVVPNQTVNFAFSSSLPSASGYTLNKVQGVTGSDGKVTVVVSSGSYPRSVAVTATLASNSNIKATSASIASGTALVDSKGMSLSVDTNSLDADYDGEYGTITVRVADRFNNPVPDNTAVYFTSTAGLVTGSASSTAGATGFCLTKSSVCTATLTTQGVSVGGTRYGRVSLLAYTDGEESFDDLNGNGVLDDVVGEYDDTAGNILFDDISEPQIDSTHFVDVDNNGSVTAADGVYEGFSCAQTLIDAGKCKHETISVWKTYPFVFSSFDRVDYSLERWNESTTKWETASSPVDVSGTNGAYFRILFYATDESANMLPIPGTSAITVANSNGGTMVPNAAPSDYTRASAQESSFYTANAAEIDLTANNDISAKYPGVVIKPFYYYFQIPKETTANTTTSGNLTISAKLTLKASSSNTAGTTTAPITLTD